VVKETPAEVELPEQIHEFAAPKSEAPSDTVSIGPSSAVLPEITDQNYLTVLGKTLDLVGWSDSQADEYSMKNYGVSVWIDLGRSDAEKFIGYLRTVSATGTGTSSGTSSPESPAPVTTTAAIAEELTGVEPPLSISFAGPGQNLGTTVNL
jgi:hypothetical protein